FQLDALEIPAGDVDVAARRRDFGAPRGAPQAHGAADALDLHLRRDGRHVDLARHRVDLDRLRTPGQGDGAVHGVDVDAAVDAGDRDRGVERLHLERAPLRHSNLDIGSVFGVVAGSVRPRFGSLDADRDLRLVAVEIEPFGARGEAARHGDLLVLGADDL